MQQQTVHERVEFMAALFILLSSILSNTYGKTRIKQCTMLSMILYICFV